MLFPPSCHQGKVRHKTCIDAQKVTNHLVKSRRPKKTVSLLKEFCFLRAILRLLCKFYQNVLAFNVNDPHKFVHNFRHFRDHFPRSCTNYKTNPPLIHYRYIYEFRKLKIPLGITNLAPVD